MGWWYDDASADYVTELKKVGIDVASDIGQFYLHAEDGPTFMSGGKEIFQLCWFIKNTNFDLILKRAREVLEIPDEYIPLDSFEGEYGFFFNKISGEVIELSLSDSLSNFKSGLLTPQWLSFNDFLESFFELGLRLSRK